MNPQDGRKERPKRGEKAPLQPAMQTNALSNAAKSQDEAEPQQDIRALQTVRSLTRMQEPLVTRGWLKKEATRARRGDVAAGTSQRKKQRRTERALAGGGYNWECGQNGDTEPVKQRDSPGRPERGQHGWDSQAPHLSNLW